MLPLSRRFGIAHAAAAAGDAGEGSLDGGSPEPPAPESAGREREEPSEREGGLKKRLQWRIKRRGTRIRRDGIIMC